RSSTPRSPTGFACTRSRGSGWWSKEAVTGARATSRRRFCGNRGDGRRRAERVRFACLGIFPRERRHWWRARSCATRGTQAVTRALVPLGVSLAFAAACGRTDPADWLLPPNADAGEGATSQGGSSGDGAGGVTGGVSGVNGNGGSPATGGVPGTGGV